MIQISRRAPTALVRYRAPQAEQHADAETSDVAYIDRLGDEIAELAAHLDAATYRLLVLLYDFDERNGWNTGFRTCAHWLSWRTGSDIGAAREKMRVARALHDLPLLSDAMRRGVLSYSKARALTRVATPANEADLLELAMHGTASHIERVVRGWRNVDRLDEADRERARHERRGLSLYVDDDGSYVLRGRLDPEAGALLQSALDMTVEQLYGRGGSDVVKWTDNPDASQQRADAIGLVAELALARGAAEDYTGAELASTPATPASGTRAERFQVMLHVDAVALQSQTVAPAAPDAGMCELDNGLRVSAETSRRISCDVSRVVMTHDEHGKVLDIGRRTRTVRMAMRRALDRRDHGCRFPGCGLRFCDAHHVKHWADGGETSLDNLLLLCRFHHRLVHEEGYTVTRTADGEFVFGRPGGAYIDDAPIPAPLGRDAAAALREDHERGGVLIDEDTVPLWAGGRMDLHMTVDGLRRAR